MSEQPVVRLQRERSEAEALFVREGESCARIAAVLGVSRASVAQWSKDGGWMAKRMERQRESPQQALAVLRRQLELQIKEIGGDTRAAPAAIDALHKLSQTVERMEARLEPKIGPMLDALYRFAKFVGAHADDAACAVIREWMDKFLAEEKRKCREG